MEYTDKELQAREMRKSDEKIKDIITATDLSKDHIKACTKDIWEAKQTERLRKKQKAQELFKLGVARKEIRAQLEIGENALRNYLRDFVGPKLDFDSLREEVREEFVTLAEKIMADPSDHPGTSITAVISKKFPEVSKAFIKDHVKDLYKRLKFIDCKEGDWTDPKTGKRYVNKHFLVEHLDWCETQVFKCLANESVGYKEFYTNSKTSPVSRFYGYEELKAKSPRIRERLAKIEEVTEKISRDGSLEKLLKTYEPQLKVLCVMLDWQNREGYWPSNRQIADFLGETVGDVKNHVNGLVKAGIITVEWAYKGDVKSQKVVKVHSGPPSLITVPITCPHCDHAFQRARDYVENGAEP